MIGFMAGKKLKENGDLNAGLRKSCDTRIHPSKPSNGGDSVDQELALKWVQKHVCPIFYLHTLRTFQPTFLADQQIWRRS